MNFGEPLNNEDWNRGYDAGFKDGNCTRTMDLLEERDALRQALEIIALGESDNPVTDAADVLVEQKIWDKDATAQWYEPKKPSLPDPLSEEEIKEMWFHIFDLNISGYDKAVLLVREVEKLQARKLK